MSQKNWRKGFATEAATAALEFAKDQLNKTEVVSFTATTNLPSIRVMEKIGMHREFPNFNHPKVASDSPLYEHVLYRIKF